MTTSPDSIAQTAGCGVRLAVRLAFVVLFGCLVVASSGCWAPLRSHGIPARCLPDSFRMPIRTAGTPLNYSNLTMQPPADYILGPNDILEVTIPGLFEGAEVHPLRVQVMASGEIHLPMVGPVLVGSKNLLQAQEDITSAYANNILVDPRVNVTLAEKSTTSILVLGKVQKPGIHILPKFENDVGHALAAAGGLLEDSSDVIEVHRRIPLLTRKPTNAVATNNRVDHPVKMARFYDETSRHSGGNPNNEIQPLQPGGCIALPAVSPSQTTRVAHLPTHPEPAFSAWINPQHSEPQPAPSNVPFFPGETAWQNASTPWQPPAGPIPVASQPGPMPGMELVPTPALPVDAMQGQVVNQGDKQILRIPLRQLGPNQLSSEDIRLQPGDVVVVPSRRHEVFYVVGQLSTNNNVRFTVGDRERELGVGFILPREREIDVVTAVVMAGYIDPIDSPTTVTVQRVGPDGHPFLIHVDLIKARYDARETVLVQAGDIIYLNPDSCWWWRRTFDRIVPELIIHPFKKGIGFN